MHNTHHSDKLECALSIGKTKSEDKHGDQKTGIHTYGRAAEIEYSNLIEWSLPAWSGKHNMKSCNVFQVKERSHWSTYSAALKTCNVIGLLGTEKDFRPNRKQKLSFDKTTVNCKCGSCLIWHPRPVLIKVYLNLSFFLSFLTVLAILNQACYRKMRGNQFRNIPYWILCSGLDRECMNKQLATKSSQ